MTDHIKIRTAEGNWVVRVAGAIVAESKAVLELTEGDLTPVTYFPRSDVAMVFFDAAPQTTHCPHKGDASYFNIVTKSGTLENAAWSYDAPIDAVAEIAGHLAFDHPAVTIEKL